MYPADRKFTDWLDWFTLNDADNPLCQFFSMPDGRTAATDTRMAVITTDQTTCGPVVFDGKGQAASLVPSLVEMLASQPTQTITLPRDQAVAMFGPCSHMTTKVCDTCDGDGTVPHSCSCDLCKISEEACRDCDGLGVANVRPEKRYVAVWGRPFDANRVGYVLAHAPEADEYTLSLHDYKHSGGTGRHLHVATPRWVAIVVEATGDAKHERECPEVMPVAEAAS